MTEMLSSVSRNEVKNKLGNHRCVAGAEDETSYETATGSGQAWHNTVGEILRGIYRNIRPEPLAPNQNTSISPFCRGEQQPAMSSSPYRISFQTKPLVICEIYNGETHIYVFMIQDWLSNLICLDLSEIDLEDVPRPLRLRWS